MPLHKNSFLDKLKAELKHLPGEEAHLKMSPFRVSKIKKEIRENAKHSATILLLYPKNEDIYSVLIQRPQYDGVHSRQIAFPGGQYDLEDENLEKTALREAFEEIGAQNILVLGKLTEVYIEPSNYLVFPYIGYINSIPEFVLQKEEVDEIIEYPIKLLQSENIIETTYVETKLYGKLKVPSFTIENKTVWGATAAILSEFKEIIKNLNF